MLAVMALLTVALAVPAFAQGPPENPGVETGADQARSLCAFSRLNDEPEAEGSEGGRTQSYGQLVRQGLKPFLPSPGVACNPTIDFEE
jgi:hypothetical protein